MFAKSRCRVASFSLRCLSKRFCKKKHRTDAPWGWSLFANGRLERRWRTSKLCWNVNSSNFAFYSSSFELCVHLHGIIVLDIFFINPNSRPLPTFLPFPHGTGGSWPGAPHHRCHPETPGGGPAPPSSCGEGSAPRHESPGHAWVHEQPGCPPVEAGEAGWGGAEVFGVRGDLPGGRFSGAYFLCGEGLRPGFVLFDFPVLVGLLSWAN